MPIVLDIPSDVEATLRRTLAHDVDRTVLETLLVGLYRSELISHRQLAKSLGLDRFATESLLKRHGVVEDLADIDELREQIRTAVELARDA